MAKKNESDYFNCLEPGDRPNQNRFIIQALNSIPTSRWGSTHDFTLKKAAAFYVTHIMVAAMVAYAVTGNWLAAFALRVLEPTVQAVVFSFHERLGQAAVRGNDHPLMSADCGI